MTTRLQKMGKIISHQDDLIARMRENEGIREQLTREFEEMLRVFADLANLFNETADEKEMIV